MLELTILFVSVIIILLILYYQNKVELPQIYEDFENYHLSSCPGGFKSFYDSNGDVICCDGEIVANKCISDRQCTLNGKGTPNMPNCVDTIMEEYSVKSKSQCSSSMPQYFEDKTKNVKGCTNGKLNSSLSGPFSNNQPTCKIYSSFNENINSKDSCYNQKMLDSVPCFGNNCTKEIVQPIPNSPILIGISFTDNMGIHRTSYTRESMEKFLNATNPNWRNQGLDLSNNIVVAEVAKAYYIDRTMDKSNIQF